MSRVKFTVFNIILITLMVVLVVMLRQKPDLASKTVAVSTSGSVSERQENLVKLTSLLNETIQKDLPGIVVWGDSLTAGSGGKGVNYPLVLQNLIHQQVYPNIPVENMGVPGETSRTIVGRAGSIPYVVNNFRIPKNTSKVEIHLTSSAGGPVAPLRRGEKGLNPVKIDGVQGIISIDQETTKSKNFTYYFERLKSGKAVSVNKGTLVEPALVNEFKNYLPIIFIGQNGGYQDNQQLVDQIKSIVNMEKYNERYLVLGLTTGTAESRSDLEKLMETEFGTKYVNLREEISSKGMEIAGVTPNKEDVLAMKMGSVPPSLLSDKVHFNAKGYEVIGEIVFERMQELGYFDSVQKLVKEMKALKITGAE